MGDKYFSQGLPPTNGVTAGKVPTVQSDGSIAYEDVAADLPGTPTAAYTKTYDVAARVIPAATAVAVVDTSSQNATTNGSDAGTTETLANALKVSYNAAQVDIAALTASNTALIADVLALRKLLVAVITDLEAVGIAG